MNSFEEMINIQNNNDILINTWNNMVREKIHEQNFINNKSSFKKSVNNILNFFNIFDSKNICNVCKNNLDKILTSVISKTIEANKIKNISSHSNKLHIDFLTKIENNFDRNTIEHSRNIFFKKCLEFTSYEILFDESECTNITFCNLVDYILENPLYRIFFVKNHNLLSKHFKNLFFKRLSIYYNVVSSYDYDSTLRFISMIIIERYCSEKPLL